MERCRVSKKYIINGKIEQMSCLVRVHSINVAK